MRIQKAAKFFVVIFGLLAKTRADDGLIAHWPLVEDAQDTSGNSLHAIVHDIDFSAPGPSGRYRTAAAFDGQTAWLEVPGNKQLQLGCDEFSVAAWVYTDPVADNGLGDIVSQYDPQTRRGFHFALKTNSGVTSTQANWRQLQFGIDQNRASNGWTDCGRPGNALLAFALCSFNGELYAGTCEPRREEAGHVYRYAGDGQWIDCGSPDRSNAVTALAVYDGRLYAATGKYRVAGSSLPESENVNLGGRVFRYDGEARWIDCGQLPLVEAVGGLVVFRGQLYASSLYRPASFFRYDGNRAWTACAIPARPDDLPGDTSHMRVESLGVYNRALYATSYDGGRVFRFDGERWFDCGQVGDNTQTYSFAILAGRLYVGTWPSGRVFRLEEPDQWVDVGRLGEEMEVMGMLVHNGRLIAGTLPLAEVYQFNAPSDWEKLARLDHTPDVRYRRAWCMAEHDGQVFCSTLPSGKIYSWRAGCVAMSLTELPPGWHHVAAVRSDAALEVFIDGQPAGREEGFDPAEFDVSNGQSLKIGFGPNDYFQGRMCDIRLYRRALTDAEIQTLATR